MTPAPSRSFEAQRRNADVTPHGRPDTARTMTFKRPSAIAPTHSGHEPRSNLAAPAAAGDGSIWGGRRRRITCSAPSATTPRIATSTIVPVTVPMSAVKLKGSAIFTNPFPAGDQKPLWATPTPEPATNPIRVTRTPTWPEPVAYRVPEAQEPPSCMPSPNRNDPMSRPTVMGAT